MASQKQTEMGPGEHWRESASTGEGLGSWLPLAECSLSDQARAQ
ncbi:hypothetical protein A2U01_0069685, partial [Trifolium medium]|nr:hypothetical protein [Trifolium medium]